MQVCSAVLATALVDVFGVFRGGLFAAGFAFIALAIVGFFLLPAIFFCLTMFRALQKCAPPGRDMEPGLAFLYLIPGVHFIFGFFLVLSMTKSLRNEFYRRGIPLDDPEPGQALGLTMCACSCACLIPVVSLLALPAYIVLWIMYWVKIAGYSRMLDFPPQYVAAPPAFPPQQYPPQP